MDKPSYHYKSPEEVRREIQKRSAVKKSRRRVLLIIFADLVISGMVLAALFYGGFLGTKKLKSENFIETKKLRISATLEWEKSKGVLYLYVENKTAEKLRYPPPQSAQKIRIIFFVKRKPVPTSLRASLTKQLSFPMELKKRKLRPGETTIYRKEVALPHNSQIQKARLELPQGSLDFSF